MTPETYYHLYTHANGSENLFREEKNYGYFLQKYAHHINPIADTYAYCLMPNHVHFLIQIKTEEQLEETFGKFETFQKLEAKISKQFSNLFSSYTQSYNKVYQRRGSLFIPNFKRKEITTESYFRNLIHYIHANPVHHGFANDIANWTWSSYQAFLFEKPTKLRRQQVIEWFGNRDDLLEFHRQPIDPKWALEMDF